MYISPPAKTRTKADPKGTKDSKIVTYPTSKTSQTGLSTEYKGTHLNSSTTGTMQTKFPSSISRINETGSKLTPPKLDSPFTTAPHTRMHNTQTESSSQTRPSKTGGIEEIRNPTDSTSTLHYLSDLSSHHSLFNPHNSLHNSNLQHIKQRYINYANQINQINHNIHGKSNMPRHGESINVVESVVSRQSPKFKVSDLADSSNLDPLQPMANNPRLLYQQKGQEIDTKSSGAFTIHHLDHSNQKEEGIQSSAPPFSASDNKENDLEASLKFVSYLKTTKMPMLEMKYQDEDYRDKLKDFAKRYIENRMPENLKTDKCPSRVFKNKFYERFQNRYQSMLDDEATQMNSFNELQRFKQAHYTAASSFIPEFYQTDLKSSLSSSDNYMYLSKYNA